MACHRLFPALLPAVSPAGVRRAHTTAVRPCRQALSACLPAASVWSPCVAPAASVWWHQLTPVAGLATSGGGRAHARKVQAKRVVSNDDIPYPELQLVGEDGEMIGVVSKTEAMSLAKAVGLDVCLVHATKPSKGFPIARIADSSHMQAKANKKAAAALEQAEAAAQASGSKKDKEIRLGPNIADHDLRIKMDKVAAFLDKGLSVRLVASHTARRSDLFAKVDQAKRDTLARAISFVAPHGRFAERIVASGASLSVTVTPVKPGGGPMAQAVADALVARLDEPVTATTVVKVSPPPAASSSS